MRFLTVQGVEIDAFTIFAGGNMVSNTDPTLGEAGVDICEGGCGCTAGPGPGALGWLAAALIFGLRRRSGRGGV